MPNLEILFTSLGLVVLDEIRFSSLNRVTDVLGGSGVYATLGARLFLPPSEAPSLGWMIHAGYDFPHSIEEELRSLNMTMILERELLRPSTRGLLEYKDPTFGSKTFKYTTPVLAVGSDRLKDTVLLASKAYHFLESPKDLEFRVLALLSLRKQAGVLERPLIIWEPAPLSCKPENLAACLGAARLVDVLSPNHLELLQLFGEPRLAPIDRSKIEILAQQFLERGIGPEGNGTIIVRAGENGCMIRTPTLSPRWLPPFYESSPEAEPNAKVVDPTGAGNAFLGAYAVGFLKTCNSVEAACYGSVGAAFALEQVGIPKRRSDGDEELWNEVSVPSRLYEYTSKLGIA